MSDAENPYAQPNLVDDGPTTPHDVATQDPDALAPRMTRLGAAIIDSILIMVVVVPGMFLSGYIQRAATQPPGFVEQLLMSLAGLVVFLVFNGYPLMTRGQTLGKMITGIQIVDHETTRLLPFYRVWLLRYLWTLPFTIIAMLIPGQNDDLVVNFAVMIDVLMIFGKQQRCLHDLIADSKVVHYKPDRGFV